MNRRYALCLAAAFVIVAVGGPAAAEQAGTFVAVDGEVEIGRGGSFSPVAIGTPVHVGDEVRTGETGKARIAFRDRSTLNVGTSSRVVIDENVFDVDEGTFKSYLKLIEGKVDNDSRPIK